MSNIIEKKDISKDAIMRYLKGQGVELDEFDTELFVTISQYYGLNPFLKEIYALPSKKGFTTVVSYLKQLEFVQKFHEYRGFEYSYGTDDYGLYCEVSIHRENRIPLKHICYAIEFLRKNGNPSDSHNKMPRFMLMKIAVCQALKLAFPDMFKYAIYSQEEAELIKESEPKTTPKPTAITNNYPINDNIALMLLCAATKDTSLSNSAAELLSDDDKAAIKANRKHYDAQLKGYKFTFSYIDEAGGDVNTYTMGINEIVNELLQLDKAISYIANDELLIIHSYLCGNSVDIHPRLKVLANYLMTVDKIKQYYA